MVCYTKIRWKIHQISRNYTTMPTLLRFSIDVNVVIVMINNFLCWHFQFNKTYLSFKLVWDCRHQSLQQNSQIFNFTLSCKHWNISNKYIKFNFFNKNVKYLHSTGYLHNICNCIKWWDSFSSIRSWQLYFLGIKIPLWPLLTDKETIHIYNNKTDKIWQFNSTKI